MVEQARVFQARSAGQLVEESEALARLDLIWEQMTDDEQDAVNAESARIADGTISEAEFCRRWGSHAQSLTHGAVVYLVPSSLGRLPLRAATPTHEWAAAWA
jgi:hypothetical protein